MNKFESEIFDALTERGIINPDYRIKIIGKENFIGNSDFGRVQVEIYPPRKRKPQLVWDLCINVVRHQIHWDKSNFAWL